MPTCDLNYPGVPPSPSLSCPVAFFPPSRSRRLGFVSRFLCLFLLKRDIVFFRSILATQDKIFFAWTFFLNFLNFLCLSISRTCTHACTHSHTLSLSLSLSLILSNSKIFQFLECSNDSHDNQSINHSIALFHSLST